MPVERYLLRCELKTARAVRGGVRARRARRRPRPRRRSRAFGRRIGLAFQLLDDVLDVSGPAERTGKHRGTDLLDGTVTLPFILARERDPALARSTRGATPAEAEAVCDAHRGDRRAGRVAERARWRSSRRRRRELPDLPQRRALELVADGVVERYS